MSARIMPMTSTMMLINARKKVESACHVISDCTWKLIARSSSHIVTIVQTASTITKSASTESGLEDFTGLNRAMNIFGFDIIKSFLLNELKTNAWPTR